MHMRGIFEYPTGEVLPTFPFELVANRNDVIRGGKKDNGIPCDVGSNSIRAATSPRSTSCIAISLRRKVSETILEAVP